MFHNQIQWSSLNHFRSVPLHHLGPTSSTISHSQCSPSPSFSHSSIPNPHANIYTRLFGVPPAIQCSPSDYSAIPSTIRCYPVQSNPTVAIQHATTVKALKAIQFVHIKSLKAQLFKRMKIHALKGQKQDPQWL